MSTAAFFDSARALKREQTGYASTGLTQEDVDGLNAIIEGWKPPETAPSAPGRGSAAFQASDRQSAPDTLSGPENGVNPTALSDAGKFFQSVHASFGILTQDQVDGFNVLLQAIAVSAWPLAFAAYGLGTAWHETNAKMQPVREAYWLSEDWRKGNLRYYPWYGRGFCQLTWQRNYQHADDELDLGGKLIADADLALQPDIAAKIMVLGMGRGWFSGKKLSDYLPASGRASEQQFTAARPIINAMDKATLIAGHAINFQTALGDGGWT